MSDCRRDPDKNAFDLIPEDPVEFTAGVASEKKANMLVRAFQNQSARHPNQDEGFARRLCGDIGFTVNQIRYWEQGRWRPRGACGPLMIINRDPNAGRHQGTRGSRPSAKN
jgi:hypothetical protein